MRFVIAIIIAWIVVIIYDIVFNLSPELDRNMKIEIGVEKIHSPLDPNRDIFPDLSR